MRNFCVVDKDLDFVENSANLVADIVLRAVVER